MTRIESTDPRWPGYVVIPSYLTYPKLHAWEIALDKAKTVSELETTKNSSGFFMELLPIAVSVIEEWHIEGLPDKVTADNFPASAKFLSWVTGILSDLYTSTNEPIDPKSPGPS